MSEKCEHTFLVDKDGQVICSKCGTRNDEVEPVDYWETQVSFEE